MNIDPSDGHNFGYGSTAWKNGVSVGTTKKSLNGDFLDPDTYKMNANFIAIVRHDGTNLECVKVWKFKTMNKSLKEYFKTVSPGREIVTEGGHIQFSTMKNVKIVTSKGHKDPIFGVDGNLAFNWWHSNNGVRICLDGGHLSAASVNDDGTHGIGNEFSADTKNGNGGEAYWHDLSFVQGSCMGTSCGVQGTDHGSSLKSGVKLGQYAIFVSHNTS